MIEMNGGKVHIVPMPRKWDNGRKMIVYEWTNCDLKYDKIWNGHLR